MTYRKWLLLRSILVLASATTLALAQQEPATVPSEGPKLRQIIITDSVEAAQRQEPIAGGGYVVVQPSVSFLSQPELAKRLAAGEGLSTDESLLGGIAAVIEKYAKEVNDAVASAVIPPQSMADGVVRVALLRGPVPSESPELRQIIITDSIEAAEKQAAIPGGGYVVVQPSVSFLNQAELAKRLAAGEGRPADERLLAGIAAVIETYAKEMDFPIAAAVIPPQSMAGGVVRVALLRGKVRDIKVGGARWFSESLLREKLRVERGETLRISELDQAITWTNTNPFRRVRVHIQPVEVGEADIIVGVEERLPLRLLASYDNTGNDILGINRYTAGVTYGNAWGRDHQVSYHFITSDNIKTFRAHAADYRVPLPWRHVVSLSASYVQANPTFLDGYFTQKGESISADLKYTVPFRAKNWRGEMSGAIAFKETNNNLEFGGMPQLSATIDVLTGTIGAAALREDKRGNWLVSGSVVGSAGSFNSRSTREIYNGSRFGANPNFYYTQLSAQRNTFLNPRMTSTIRALVQLASTNLVPTEQLSIGGLATVRGYEERILTGDSGYTLTHELQHRLPSVSLGKRVPKIDLAGLFFVDYGRIVIKHPAVRERKSDFLASAGVGLRASVGNRFSASVDYARQIEEVELPDARHDRVHVRMTLSY